jgi:hypothetical protein
MKRCRKKRSGWRRRWLRKNLGLEVVATSMVRESVGPRVPAKTSTICFILK